MNSSEVWYYADGQQSVGPMSLAEVKAALPKLDGKETLVFGPGLVQWTEAKHVDEIMEEVSPPTPPPLRQSSRRSDEIDYEIFGEEMQYVVVELDPGEMVLAEAGAMMFMTSEIKMETRFGDPSKQDNSLLGKLMTAGKRVMTGESLFITTFTQTGKGKGQVAFASPYPGKILAVDLTQIGGELICQKDSFVCAARGIELGIAFQKKIGVGLFGGEGFVMQKLTGDGVAMIHAGGTLMRRTLRPGEVLKLDTGCLVALQPSVKYDIQFVGGFKNTLFGGEGLFLATVSGPGEVWLQSLPFSRLAGRMMSAGIGASRKDEGSVLGGIGSMLMGGNE
ncbi:TIGR00266 family protein [Schlesneria sp. DSM 10557]|uniref:TIGR00266 family protein n=1 Tax=Schlesneria sp. DSM 10557 TaxID=3044399 RepID=UPI0035A176FC